MRDEGFIVHRLRGMSKVGEGGGGGRVVLMTMVAFLLFSVRRRGLSA